MGRRSLLTEEKIEKIKELAISGKTDRQISEMIGVSERTITNWKISDEKFFLSLKSWKSEADEKVEKSLYKRALGFKYTYEKEKVLSDGRKVLYKETEYYPPESTAMIFWLKNRQPENWRDRKEVTGEGGEGIKVIIEDYREGVKNED